MSSGIDLKAQVHGTHGICHAEFSMFGRVQSAKINGHGCALKDAMRFPC